MGKRVIQVQSGVGERAGLWVFRNPFRVPKVIIAVGFESRMQDPEVCFQMKQNKNQEHKQISSYK